MGIRPANFFNYSEKHEISGDLLFTKVSPKEFKTHTEDEKCAQVFHKIAHVLSFPWRSTLRCLAHAIEPFPGEHKKIFSHSIPNTLLNGVIHITALVGAILLLPLGIVSLPIALPFHLYSHLNRKEVTAIYNPEVIIPEKDSNTIHVRTHNLGFVYEFFRVIGDLRDVKTRAEEIGNWVLADENAPEVICFQESFHIDGTEVLCNKLKEKYPYIIHSIAPHGLGLNNGGIIASMYPIKTFSYRLFDNMLGPERLSTRGLLRVLIEKESQAIDIYSTHTQALLGKDRAEVRKAQIEQIKKWMDEDRQDSVKQILVGDMNSTRVTAWGEDNHEDDEFYKAMDKYFDDLFLNDHDELGIRTDGAPQFLTHDSPNVSEGEPISLEEPSGSWYTGPFANKGFAIEMKEWFERTFNGVPEKTIAEGKEVPEDHSWGTKDWAKHQYLKTARFDYILGRKGELEGAVEIRRVKVAPGTESAPSDHAPVDGIIDI